MGGAVDDGTPKQSYPWYYGFTAFCFFAAGNISLNYLNSWVQHPSPTGIPGQGKAGFTFPFFYTMWHMLASAIAALIMQLTCNKPKTGSPYPTFSQLWDYKFQLVPIATLTVLNNGCNNLSLGLIALYMNQVIKATGPAPTAFFEFLFMGKVYNIQIYAAVTAIVVGSILANFTSILEGGTSQIMGVIWCLVSLLAASLRPVLQRMLIAGDKKAGAAAAAEPPKPPLTVPQALFWDCGISFVGMGVVWLASDERVGSIEYLRGTTGNPNSGLLALAVIAGSATIAFVFNFATYYFIMYTSALSSTIGSNAVKIFIIVVSAFTDNLDTGGLDLVSWIGVITVVTSIVTYTYFQQLFKNQQQNLSQNPSLFKIAADEKAAPLASKEEGGSAARSGWMAYFSSAQDEEANASKPTENTPLNAEPPVKPLLAADNRV